MNHYNLPRLDSNGGKMGPPNGNLKIGNMLNQWTEWGTLLQTNPYYDRLAMIIWFQSLQFSTLGQVQNGNSNWDSPGNQHSRGNQQSSVRDFLSNCAMINSQVNIHDFSKTQSMANNVLNL